MNGIVKEDKTVAAFRVWIRDLVLRQNVIQYWAGLKTHPQCLTSIYKIIKIISYRPVKMVLAAQYIQLFGDRYPYMRIPRVPQLIGETQVNFALKFETHYIKYFLATPLTNTLTGTPVYKRFMGDKYFPFFFPRHEIISGIISRLLVSAEMEGILFPIIFLLRAALRKAFIKTKVQFLWKIQGELLLPKTIDAITQRCRDLSDVKEQKESKALGSEDLS